MNKRSKDDIEWQALKKRIKERDKNMCRGLRCMSTGEYKEFLNSHPAGLAPLDPAHILEVSTDGDLCYVDKNILTLCRGFHTRIDSLQDPITGNSCSLNRRFYWLWRCIKSEIIHYDEDTDYQQLCRDYIIGENK
jgi:hypothetical protein